MQPPLGDSANVHNVQIERLGFTERWVFSDFENVTDLQNQPMSLVSLNIRILDLK